METPIETVYNERNDHSTRFWTLPGIGSPFGISITLIREYPGREASSANGNIECALLLFSNTRNAHEFLGQLRLVVDETSIPMLNVGIASKTADDIISTTYRGEQGYQLMHTLVLTPENAEWLGKAESVKITTTDNEYIWPQSVKDALIEILRP